MNKKGSEGALWTVIVAIIAVVILVIVLWIFRDQIMQGFESLQKILTGVHDASSEVNISKIVK
tara:strand:+ start:291 stop:479 length:189 start_codon:yes stop_codon:yes gene_type:complete